MENIKEEKARPEFEQGWHELYRSSIVRSIESQYQTEILRNYAIAQLVDVGDKFLIKWVERWVPLTDEELKERYGR